MQFNWKILFMLSAVFLIVVPSAAQTSNELQQRYGTPDEEGRFIVRSNILASVTFTRDGRARRIVVEPQDAQALNGSSLQLIGAETVAEVIDELAPVNQRGEHVNSIIFNAGCTSIRTEVYEQVNISRVITCALGGGVTSVEINWRALRGR